jgi:hypothetical protein
MNNKFFQYFTKLDGDDKMEAFGVLVQIYNEDFTGNLLKIDKQGNRIEFGFDNYTSEGNKILFETETVLQGYAEVSNYSGFKITNKIENSYTIIIPHEKDVSFKDSWGSSSTSNDIVISKGLRFNHQTDNLVIQKPGQGDGGDGKIIIPYGTDLTNIGSGGGSYTPPIPENLNAYTTGYTYSNLGNNVLFQYYDTGVGVYMKQENDDSHTSCLFNIDKTYNSISIGTAANYKGNVQIGGENLVLYAKEYFKMNVSNGTNYNINFSFTEDEIIFKNTSNIIPAKQNKKIIIPFDTDLTNIGTDLTNLETRLTTLESGSGSGSNNLIAFRQSLIENAIVNNPNYGLDQLTMSEIKIYTPIKSLVGDDIFPKTTHTLLTAYYTSYIKTNFPQTTGSQYKQLIRYYSTDETNPVIYISVVNSTYYTSPRLYIEIRKNNADIHKCYTITLTTPKIVIDLTDELATVRPNEEIKDAEFLSANFGVGDSDEFYRHCVNILSNIFISYTYED